MRRAGAQSVLLLLIGGALMKIALAGSYARYVKVGSRWNLLAAAAVLLAVAVLTLAHAWWAAGRSGSEPGDDRHGGAHDGHGHHRFEPSWLLVAPALVLLLVAPPALGAYAASRGGTALAAGAGSDFPPLPPGDPVRLSLLDYASRAIYDQGHSLGTRPIVVSGFLAPGGHGTRYLTRMVITCCAADARPIKVGLAGDLPDGAAADGWLEVTGTFLPRKDADPVNGEPIPYLQVGSARTIAAPDHPYES